MNGPEHFREADLILTSDPCEYGCPHSGCVHEMRMLARAQAHATLALTAATVAAGVGAMPIREGHAWLDVTGTKSSDAEGASDGS